MAGRTSRNDHHDSLFHLAFARPAQAADLFRRHLPAPVVGIAVRARTDRAAATRRATISEEEPMRSALAEQIRDTQRAREAKLTPDGRVRLALLLGERDLRAFASARGTSLREAWRQLRQAEQDGRVRSGAMDFGEP